MLLKRENKNLASWVIVLNVLFLHSTNTSGDISSFYDAADHYWDFEQSPMTQIADQKTGTTIHLHKSPTIVNSPTGKAIYLPGTPMWNSSVDLMEVHDSSCLFDPSNCATGSLSITMFIKFRANRRQSINNTQMFFGNSEGLALRQGVSIYYNETSKKLNATVFGSTKYCFRWLGMVMNSWTHLHVRWESIGELEVFVDGNVDSSGDVKCGTMTTPFPTENMYSLGHGAFPVAYFDNLAIWYQQIAPFTAFWNHITDHGGSTTLSLGITLWDKPWDPNLGNAWSSGFQALETEFINQIQTMYNQSDNKPSEIVVDQFLTNSGTVQADVSITFLSKTIWQDSLILQDSLEINGSLGSTASITDCNADDGFFCNGLEIVTTCTSTARTSITIKFNHVPDVNQHIDLMGYSVLYKQTDTNEWWRAKNIRGGWMQHQTISDLKPYTNYSIRVAPYSFQAGGLAGPIQVNETKEDVPSIGPVILEAYSINKTSIFLRWDERSIPEDKWNGIPRGFRIHGNGNPCTGFHINAQYVALNVSSFVLTGLRAWVWYIVKISGVTTPGHGEATKKGIKTNDSVPSKAPGDIQLTHTSNHSVKVTWNEVALCFIHGPLQSYEVSFRDVEGGSTDIMHNVTVPAGDERRLNFTNLTIYWHYGVRIKAFTRHGPGPWSEEVTGMTDEWVPIVAPSNVSAYNPTTNKIRLSWYFENNVRDVLGILTGFRIFYKLSNSSSAPEHLHEVGANERQADITGLNIYRFYTFSVAGMTRKGHGEISSNVSMKTLGTAPLHSPVPVEMSNTSSTSLHVAWGEVPPAYHHDEVTGYRIFSEETGNPGVVIANMTFSLDVNSTEFTGLKKFTSYTARVRAYSFFGEGPEDTVTALTDEDIPSQAPADPRLFNTSSTSLKAVWGPVPDCCRHGIILGYRLFLKDNISGAFVRTENAAGAEDEFEFSSLLKFYGYRFSILAFTIKGDGPVNEESSAMTEEDVPIEAPFNVTGQNTSAWSLLVGWDFDPNVRHVLGILLGYDVFYRSLNDSGALWESKAVWDPLARQTELTGFEEYRDYNITVTAFTRIGDGVGSPFIVTRTDEHVPRAPPTDVTSTNTSSTSLRVNWGEVPFLDRLGVIRGYRVLIWRTNQSEEILRNVTIPVPSRNISFTKLEMFTNYTIQVLAFTVKGDGNKSEPIVVITDEDVPTWRPAGIASWNTSSTSILLSWQPLADLYYLHGRLRGYTITYERVDGLLFKEQINTSSSTLSLELTGLDEYVEYLFEVRAFTIKGSGPHIYISCFTAEDVPAAPPQNVLGFNISKHDIRVFWEEVPYRDVNSIILGYFVFFNETLEDVFNQTVEFPTTNTTLSFLRPYTFYSIQVFAFAIKGNGPRSLPISIRTEEEAPQVYPWNVTGYNTSSTTVYIQWSPIPPEMVAGVLREYRIVYEELSYDNEPVRRHTLTLPVDQLFANLTDLAKYRNYTFELQGISKFFGVRSPPIMIITDQDVPSLPPSNVTTSNTSSTSLLITWDHYPRLFVNGILLGYRVFYHEILQQIGARRRRRAIESLNETVEVLTPNTTFLKISNLKKFTNYSFRIAGFTSKGEGKISQTFNVSTDEDIPSKPPVNLNAVNLSGPHSIVVSWEPVPEGFVYGILRGYRVLYKMLTLAGEATKAPTLNKTTDEKTLNTTLEDLQNYALYDIRVVAFTIKGDGAASQSIVADTCKCPLQMTTNWYSIGPYITRQGSSLEGPFPFILNGAAHTCCTPCVNGHGHTTVDYEHDKEGIAAEKENVSVVQKIDNEADMSFPIEGFKGQIAYGIYRYVPLMESGGTALVGSLPTPVEKTSFVIMVGSSCFPMMIMAFLMIMFSGSVIWAIECRTNPEEFQGQFTRGLWEGFWWAYITCTTLGYGDKVPRSFLGRVFTIVWTLVGLILMTFLLADITNALISYSLLGPTQKGMYGAKIGAIQGSPEYRLGVRKVATMNPGKQYHTYGEVNKALVNRDVESALIDLYVLSYQEELYSNPNLRVFKVYDYKKTYGVVLAGPSMKLEKCFLEFVRLNKGDISHKIVETVRTPETHEESIAEEVSSGLFDSSADQFRLCLLCCSGLLLAAIFCGLVYNIHRAIKRRSRIAIMKNHLAEMRSEMRQEVNEFYRRFNRVVNEHREAHIRERRRFCKRISKTSNFYSITPASFRTSAENDTSQA